MLQRSLVILMTSCAIGSTLSLEQENADLNPREPTKMNIVNIPTTHILKSILLFSSLLLIILFHKAPLRERRGHADCDPCVCCTQETMITSFRRLSQHVAYL